MSEKRNPAADQLSSYSSQHSVSQQTFNANTGAPANRATASNGTPIDTITASKTHGPKGPIVLQDFTLIDHLAAFDRERIPERVVHAKGAGAFGYFEVTHDISQYTAAKVFERVGKRT
eukprot:TRINITY_DN1563_c0_g1_i2.p4 TRINITY_DN1563_c0_g1~~TRINITY_DN1563_c0_g1_i2.p4  ORF type:complete len:118 (+),score=10.92 TRINITY_DN1563_c0_g1_i2:74-427(+)